MTRRIAIEDLVFLPGRRLRPAWALWVLSALTAPALAATYSVRQDGAGDFTTIQACADVVQAGDACLVSGGTYDEVVSPAGSGTPGSLITFCADGNAVVAGFRLLARGHIRIEGFEITCLPAGRSDAAIFLSGADGTEIVGNTIHHNAGIGIWLHHGAPSSDVVIRNNRIYFTGCTPGRCIGDGGIVCHGNNVLIEDNDISHVGDFTNTWGQRIVLRNNTFHDVYLEDFPEYFDLPSHDPLGHHVDAVQHFSSVNALHFLLFENNIVRDVPLANVHCGIFQDQDGTVSDSDVVYRHNTFYELGGAMVIINPFLDFRAVNNTMVNLNLYPPRGNTPFSASSGMGPSANIKLVNNLFYNTTRQVAWAEPYSIDAGSRAGFQADFNLACFSGAPDPLEVNGFLDQDPLFTNMAVHDYSLQPGSPAMDRGGPLTRVAASDAGTGVALTVEDARFFQDGWAGVDSDWIAVGDVARTAEVIAIDYPGNVLTLSGPVTRSANDPVWLFRNSSGAIVLSGTAPDIGSSERGASPGAITGLLAVKNGFDDILMTWNGEPVADGFNVWYVGQEQDVSLARQANQPPAAPVAGCAVPSPAAGLTCTDVGAVSRGAPTVFFYQVRACRVSAPEGP